MEAWEKAAGHENATGSFQWGLTPRRRSKEEGRKQWAGSEAGYAWMVWWYLLVFDLC